MQKFLEARDRSQLIEAAPVACAFGLFQPRANRRQIQRSAGVFSSIGWLFSVICCYLWHVQQVSSF